MVMEEEEVEMERGNEIWGEGGGGGGGGGGSGRDIFETF